MTIFGLRMVLYLEYNVFHRWFDQFEDSDTKTTYHRFNGKYWDAKLRNCWDNSPDIF